MRRGRTDGTIKVGRGKSDWKGVVYVAEGLRFVLRVNTRDASAKQCICSVISMGLTCSKVSPKDVMDQGGNCRMINAISVRKRLKEMKNVNRPLAMRLKVCILLILRDIDARWVIGLVKPKTAVELKMIPWRDFLR